MLIFHPQTLYQLLFLAADAKTPSATDAQHRRTPGLGFALTVTARCPPNAQEIPSSQFATKSRLLFANPAMRVLLITGSFPPMRCGVGDYTHRLAEALALRPNMSVAVLTSRAAASASSNRTFDLFPVMESWAIGEVAMVHQIVESWLPDLVHIQYPTLGYGQQLLPWLLPKFLYRSGNPVVQTWHEIYNPKWLLTSRLLYGFISKALVPGAVVVVRENFKQETSTLLKWAFRRKTVRFIQNAAALPSIELTPWERKAIRLEYARPNCKVIVFFGFIYPRKRVELLFQIADPAEYHIVIIGDGFREEDLKNHHSSVKNTVAEYHDSIKQLARSECWKGKVTMTGFLPDQVAARVLAAADAIVLPFLGGGSWNTSLHAAQAQRTFVLTTSQVRRGYDSSVNTYFASEHDLDGMRRALNHYVGKTTATPLVNTEAWTGIAEAHINLYQTQLRGRARIESDSTAKFPNS